MPFSCRLSPKRTLYLAFGHDEEVGGALGAKAMAARLQERGVQLEFVLDEGGPLLVDGLHPFVQNTAVALVGTAEKVCTVIGRNCLLPTCCQLVTS